MTDLPSRAQAVAAIAAAHADAVDRDARFPAEAFRAASLERLLGILVPAELGGEGASVSDVSDICYVLGRACASTAMIFAMHQIMVAILLRHGRDSRWHRDLLGRLVTGQLLIASSTTEGQGGGDLRASVCAVEQLGSRFALTKEATVMSYGAEADAILTTARRSPEAPPTDQVLVAVLKQQYSLETIQEWQTLGMRGTCSAGFILKTAGASEQIVPGSYATIQTHTMMPVAHLTWSSVWAGVAAGAVERARRFVRTAARRGGGQLPPGALHLTRAVMSLRSLRSSITSALRRFESLGEATEQFELLDFQNAMNLLKVNASETATAIVMSCMQACGLAGYRNHGEFSVARHLRDVLSSSIMINNERILANSAAASMLVEAPESLQD
jgi:acyl-CoA dehydrogenase